MRALHAVVGQYPHTAALFEASGVPTTNAAEVTLEFRTLREEPAAFSRMANDAEFDICEMPIVSYLVARDRGTPIRALPIFVTRGFDQRRLVRSIASGVATPRDLEGRAVGVRYYGFTDGTWARIALARTFGVDLDRITWVTNTAETVESAILPTNVRHVPDADLVSMTEAGDLAALILNLGQRVASEGLAPLFTNPDETERSWFETTGVYPIHHVMVARDDVLHELPTLPSALLHAFGSAKDHFLARLDSGAPQSDEERAIDATRAFMGPDPLPYGIAANREVLGMVVRASFDQHLIERHASVEDAFLEV